MFAHPELKIGVDRIEEMIGDAPDPCVFRFFKISYFERNIGSLVFFLPEHHQLSSHFQQ